MKQVIIGSSVFRGGSLRRPAPRMFRAGPKHGARRWGRRGRSMTSVATLSATAALFADPARAAMLVALMDGRALSAGELAGAAGVAPPTASGHLARLLDAGLIALERQG